MPHLAKYTCFCSDTNKILEGSSPETDDSASIYTDQYQIASLCASYLHCNTSPSQPRIAHRRLSKEQHHSCLHMLRICTFPLSQIQYVGPVMNMPWIIYKFKYLVKKLSWHHLNLVTVSIFQFVRKILYCDCNFVTCWWLIWGHKLRFRQASLVLNQNPAVTPTHLTCLAHLLPGAQHVNGGWHERPLGLVGVKWPPSFICVVNICNNLVASR